MKYFYIVAIVTYNFNTFINTNYIKTKGAFNIKEYENELINEKGASNVVVANFIEVDKEFVKINCPDLIDK